MSNESKTTTNHSEIKKWVEDRKGKPARVKKTGDENDIGLLRINFPGGSEENIENITWKEFFEKFDEKKLALLYQDKKLNGEVSTFNKFVSHS